MKNIEDKYSFLITDTKEFISVEPVSRLESDEYYISQIIKGVKIKIYYYIDHDDPINAYIVPGLTSHDYIDSKYFDTFGVGEVIASYLKSLNFLLSNHIKVRKEKDHVVLIGFPENFSIDVYITKKLFEMLTPEERASIYLHEIGHAVYYKNFIPFSTLYVLNTINYIYHGVNESKFPDIIKKPVATLYYISNIGSFYFSRQNEFSADKFVHDVGYSDVYVSVLNKLKNKFEKKKKLNKSFFDDMFKNLSDIFSTHPGLSKRIQKMDDRKYIKEDMGLTVGIIAGGILSYALIQYVYNQIEKKEKYEFYTIINRLRKLYYIIDQEEKFKEILIKYEHCVDGIKSITDVINFCLTPYFEENIEFLKNHPSIRTKYRSEYKSLEKSMEDFLIHVKKENKHK